MLLYLALVIPPLLLAFYAQWAVKHNFTKYARVRPASGLSGAEAARLMLEEAGIHNVRIERVDGFLSDHYDPSSRTVRLSPDVYGGTSISAVGVACHEVGHAIQHARSYAPLVIRNMAVPVASFGSGIGLWMVIIGSLLQFYSLAWIGVALFGAVVFFQLVNLPVEFDASARAKRMLQSMGILRPGPEMAAVSAVLGAAALTYVAATAQALGQLIYFVIMLLNSQNRE